VIGKRIDQIELFTDPATTGVSAGAIVRGNGDGARVMMAHHDTVIEADDHVIVFVSNNRMIPKVEKLFQVGAGFL
jgi:trk system potassium uptake protein TrkA